MKPADIAELYRRLAAANPNPRSELEYSNPFELLVAVVLSAQATDVGVNKATALLYPVANTPDKLLALGEEGLRGYIKTIGLYQTKAKNVIGLCRQLLERHGGEVPRDRAALEALPGVGRKTANVVLNVTFGGHAHLPYRQPHRAGAGNQSRQDLRETGKDHARALSAACPSLADPAWPLRVQGAHAGVLALRDRRFVPLQAQDARCRGDAGSTRETARASDQ